MYDLHLHTRYSDGDWPVAKVLAEAARRGLHGVSITDHNGVWGAQEGYQAAQGHRLAYVEGIEVTARYEGVDVHILGYARHFNAAVVTDGLAATRAGYAARIQDMITQCHAHGYTDIAFATIKAERATQAAPSYISYDVARQLMHVYDLPWDEVRALTTRGGACYVPYGDWTLTPREAIALIERAGGRAFLAHPGIIVHEAGREAFERLLKELMEAKVAGIEVRHPFHDQVLIRELQKFCQEHGLLVSGGSDWHGPGRYHDRQFGHAGISDEEFTRLRDALP